MEFKVYLGKCGLPVPTWKKISGETLHHITCLLFHELYFLVSAYIMMNIKRMEEDVRIQLYQAIEANSFRKVLACIREGVNLDISDSNGQTPLILASEKGYTEIVGELLNQNVDTNARDEDGWTALIAASKEGYIDVVSLLLEHASKYNIADLGGWTPLIWAAYKGHVDVVQELLRYGANPEHRGQHNMTALIWAAGRGHIDVVKELLNNGAKPEVADKYGTSALIWACRKGHYEVSKLLIIAGANVNGTGTNGWTSLIMAAKGGYFDVVSLLLDENSNVNAVDQDGLSALAWASKEGHNDIVEKLLDKGAFVNMPDRHGDSPLILASKEGHGKVVRTLVNAYADVEMTDSEGKTALYHSVEKDQVSVVRELLLANANTEAVNKDGETPLLCGTIKKHTQCVKLLLDKGASISVVDKNGDTPLHIAIRCRYTGLCEILLNDQKNSKLLHQPNKAGETPYSLDLVNKPSILSTVFNSTCSFVMVERSQYQKTTKTNQINALSTSLNLNGLEENDFDQMDFNNQQELLLSTTADFIFQASFRTPLSFGIYSRWGSGKSLQLERLSELISEHIQQEPLQPFSITAPVVVVSIFIALIFSVFVWVVSGSVNGCVGAAILISFVIVLFFVFARVALVSTKDSLHKVGVVMTNFIYRFSWFFKLIYCVPPCIRDLRPLLRVHAIKIDFTRTLLVGDNQMTTLVNFTREINDAIEADLGVIIPRLYRIFQTNPYRSRDDKKPNLKAKWKKTFCCVPAYLISLIALICLLVGLISYGMYGFKGPGAVVAVQISCLCVIGAFMLANLAKFVVIIYCLILPMKQRIRFVSTQAGIQEETFINVVKQELELCTDMLECIDGFSHRQTRIFLTIDLLDSLEQQKVLMLINVINMLISEEGFPFIFVLSVDPRLLVKAIDQNMSYLQGSYMNSYDYLRNLVELPYYVYDPQKFPVNNLIPLELRSSLDDQQFSDSEHAELEWDDNADINGDVSSYISQDTLSQTPGNGNVPNGKDLPNQTLQRSMRSIKLLNYEANGIEDEEGTNQQELSNLIRLKMNGSLRDIRRIMNIVSLSGLILRNLDVTFQFTRLAIWVNLCDFWPHKASWIMILCSDTSLALPGKMSVRRLYNAIGYGMPMISDVEECSTNANNYFETFIASHKPVITVRDVRSFISCTFYLDPTIRNLMVDYMVAIKSGSLSKNPSIQQQYSSRTSNLPMSPSESNKFLWRGGGIEEPYLSKLTVEEVVTQLSDIDGIDSNHIPQYRDKILENNVNGRVLATCELNELRDAMQMKFGDWQLFKAWISSLRYKEGSIRSEKLSLFHPSSRGNSIVDGSQTESIPESPKQSSTCSNTQRSGIRLPALDESPRSSNIPYASHSSRSGTPMYSTSNNNDSKRTSSRGGGRKSMLLDIDTDSSSPLKDIHSPNPGWHRSADSGFASTDVDPNIRILQPIQPQNSLSYDNDRNQVNTRTQQTTTRRKGKQQSKQRVISPSTYDSDLLQLSDNNSQDEESSLITTILVNDTWNKKNGDSITYNNIYKSGEPTNLVSSDEYLAGKREVNPKKTWKFAQLSDQEDSCSVQNPRDRRENTVNETSFIANNSNTRQPKTHQTRKRPPSLSDVPLPPATMLNETKDFYVNELDSNSNEQLILSPSSTERKTAFQNAAKLRGISVYNEENSDDSEKEVLVNGNRNT